jgi:hypothetical protein
MMGKERRDVGAVGDRIFAAMVAVRADGSTTGIRIKYFQMADFK